MMKAWMTALVLSVGAGVVPAPGAVVMTELPVPWLLYDPAALSALYTTVDVNGDSQTDFTFRYAFSGIDMRTERNNRVVIYPSPPPNIGGPVEPLPPGYVISSTLANGNAWISSDPVGGYVDPGEVSFAGITLVYDTGSESRFPYVLTRAAIGFELYLPDGVHYGYLDVEGQHDTPGLRVYGWAYESEANTPITVGALPEPGRGVLLVLGGIICTLRRRRKA